MPSDEQGSGGVVLDALDVALLVSAPLDQIHCEYFIGGSVASSLQGEPRATNDIDFVVAMLTWKVPAFAAALTKQWRDVVEVLRVSGPQIDPQYLDQWASRLGVAPLLARARMQAAGGSSP